MIFFLYVLLYLYRWRSTIADVHAEGIVPQSINTNNDRNIYIYSIHFSAHILFWTLYLKQPAVRGGDETRIKGSRLTRRMKRARKCRPIYIHIYSSPYNGWIYARKTYDYHTHIAATAYHPQRCDSISIKYGVFPPALTMWKVSNGLPYCKTCFMLVSNLVTGRWRQRLLLQQ